MNETDSLDTTIVIADDREMLTIYDPVVDSINDLSPEMKAKLLAMNARFRGKMLQPESSPSDGSRSGDR